uniref:Uncharacterized protein n=1 Tax=Arundo donax TaxID=35708 RepID=A0A0A8Z769_ARUDO
MPPSRRDLAAEFGLCSPPSVRILCSAGNLVTV